MDGEALLQRGQLGLSEGFAQPGLTDQDEGERGRAVEVEVRQQAQVVEGVGREAVGVVEDEDLGTLGAGELVEDGLGGLGRGALGAYAVADGELADEAERAAGAEARVDEVRLGLVERVGKRPQERGLAEPGVGHEDGRGTGRQGQRQPGQGLGEGAVTQQGGVADGAGERECREVEVAEQVVDVHDEGSLLGLRARRAAR